ELVSDDVVCVGDRPAERQDDAPPERFGDAAGSFTQLALDRVGLLKVCVRRIQDERLASAQLMGEELLEPGVPTFGKPGRDIHAILLGWIVVNVEVIGFQNSKVKFLVLNFVLAEILSSGWSGNQR